MNTPLLVAEKTRLQRIWRRLTVVRFAITIFLPKNLLTLVLGISSIYWRSMDQVAEFLLEPPDEGGSFLGRIVFVLLCLALQVYWIASVLKWNRRFDKTPNSIHFNGLYFEKVLDGEKSLLIIRPSRKRGSLLISKNSIPLRISPGINEYQFIEMADSHTKYCEYVRKGLYG